MSQATESAAAEPNHGFEGSRRLTGPNRWFAGTAVTLTPLGPAAHDAAAHRRWAARVQALCAQLGWPAPQPQVQAHVREPMLQFAAPQALLFTATEINEWAWERSAAEAGVQGFDLAQDLGENAAGVFAARAAAEARPALQALRAAAAARRLPVFVDDGAASVGVGGQTWALDELPAPEAIPWEARRGASVALVTGSNGKTTTVRLLAAMVQASGQRVGHCCTEGAFADGRQVLAGDCSGPEGARAVLRHPGLQTAVLEVARGGILRRGLAVEEASVAVVTNIQPDHLGVSGIDSAADLAEVKLTVARAVRRSGTLVLNGADALLMAAAARLPHAAQARQALFALDFDHPVLAAHRAAGGASCGLRAGQLWLGGQALGDVTLFPLTLGGTARHNIANAAAAALAAQALGLGEDAISTTLQRFGSQPLDNPGRLECHRHHGATVLIDYAHNPDGLAELLRVARLFQPARLGLLLGQAGNRDDTAISALVQVAAAAAPDRIVIKELPHMLRGRQPGEVPALIEKGLRAAGYGPGRWQCVADEGEAAQTLLDWAQPGDVLVLPIHTPAVRASLELGG